MDREPQVNLEAYAAIDMHNINLIYMRRSVMEDLIDDATFSDKIYGGFVRIKISGVGQKQDIYRLVKVVGTHKVPEKYSIGKKMTNFALEILNLDKKEIIKMDTISNQDFTEEECKRLRQSMKCGLIGRLKVGDIQEKAKILQSVRVNDWFENEKERLGHLRDRASETGRRKELRECVEKLQLLNNSEERNRRINEVLEVHPDSHMDPNYESAEEMDDKKTVGRSINRTRSDMSIPRRKSKYPNTMQNHLQKVSDSSRHPKNLSSESAIHGSGAGRKFENNTVGNSAMYEAGSLSSSGVTMSGDMEPEKVWHYKDPAGNVQGPFTLLQLSKWTSYFPRDLRVWLTFESEERSLLLTEVLSKQQKDFTQAASLTSSKATLASTRHTMNGPSVDHTNAPSPVGYSMAGSCGITVQSNKFYAPERECAYSPDDSLSLSTSSVPPKNVHSVNSQAQGQTKHSVFIRSPGNSYGQTGLHHEGIQVGCSGELNHRDSSGALWSPTMAHMSFRHGNEESHQNQHVPWSQCQHDSKGGSQCGSVKDLNSRRDLSKNLPTQRVGRDVSSPVFAWSPSESRTASSQHEGSCLSSTANPNFLDELHSSIASAKSTSCAPATPIEDRGSSSPSGMLSHSGRVPICSPDSVPLTSASDICKMEEIMNQQRTLEADTSNASVNQSPQSKIFHASSPDNQDIDCEVPSPTPKSESKELAVDNSGVAPASPENVTTTNSPGSDTHRMEKIVSQQKVTEVVASKSSDNHSPQSKVSPASCNDRDLECECPTSSPRCENKVPAVENSLLTSTAPENLTATSATASDTCKMEEFVSQQKVLETNASNAPLHKPPRSHNSDLSSPDNQDIGRECPPRSDSKEHLLGNSVLTSTAPENVTADSTTASDTCKMEEFVNQQKILETNASNAKLHQPPRSHNSDVSSPANQDIGRECPPRSDSKESLLDNSVLTSTSPENVTAASATASDTCKMEEFMNQQKTLETDASNAPLHQSPRSHISHVSSPDDQDIGRECPPRSDSKESLLDNSVLTSTAPENPMTASASASDTCKMEEFMNQQKALEKDASNAPLHQSPRSYISHVSSPDNEDIGRECPPRSDSKESLLDNSVLTSTAPENPMTASASASDTCEIEEFVNQQKTLETDASNAPLNQPPHSHICPVSSSVNQDIESESPCPTPIYGSNEPLVDYSVLTSAGPENVPTTSAPASITWKVEMSNNERIVEADASNVSLNQLPRSSTLCPDNQDMECAFSSPTPRSESVQPLMDNSGLTSILPENLTSTSASASDMCKMEIMNENKTLEANPSNGSVIQPLQSKVLSSSDVLDIERELPTSPGPGVEIKELVVVSSVLSAAPENLIKHDADSPDAFVSPKSGPPTGGPRPEVKEMVVVSSVLTSAVPENLEQHVDSPDPFLSPNSVPPTGELYAMKSDFKCKETSQEELYCEGESTVVTRGNMLIDPSCGAESIDVSDVLESLMEEQRCGTLYMQGTTDLEDFLATSAGEEPQCSSPIALSPWGEPSYYQGDAIDSVWGVQDDPINDMWPLLSPRPMLQPSSGIGTEGKDDINEVGLANCNNEIVQRGSMLREDNVNQMNLGAPTDWVLPELVPSIPNDMSISSTEVVGWQPSANQSLNEGTTWSTSLNLNMANNEKAEPSSKRTWEQSRKQESTKSSVSSSGEATGNIRKDMNPPSSNANRGEQRGHHHHRSRYSEISESWLLSSNHSRSRSDRFGSSGSSRSTSKGHSRG